MGTDNSALADRDSTGRRRARDASLRVAVVGCGQIADAHIQELRRMGGVCVDAVCDREPAMVEQAALRHGIEHRYVDFDRLLRERRPDVVHLTTPPHTHLELGRRALARAAHLFVEKPFAPTVEEAEALLDAAQHADRLVGVGYIYAFSPEVERLLQSVRAGELGEVVHVEVYMGYNLEGPFGRHIMADPDHWVHRLPGGLPHNNLSHPLSLILTYLSELDFDVSVQGQRRRANRFEDVRDRFYDELRISLMGKRSTAAIVFSCSTRPVQLHVQVFGTRASARASLDARSVHWIRGADLPGPFAKVQWARREAREAIREYRGRVKDLLFTRLHYFEGMQRLFQRFYEAIRQGGPSPTSCDQIRAIVGIMEKVFEELHLESTRGALA